MEEKSKTAIYLCNDTAGEWHILFDETWNEWNANLKDRIIFIQKKYPTFSVQDIFPWKDELCETIDPALFFVSHLVQPDLYLRIRPKKEIAVLKELQAHQIAFQQLSSTCLVLPNSSKIDTILKMDEEVVVQDRSSQRIADFLQLLAIHNSRFTIWDCCAASGGKSILALDILQNVQLTVSDIRNSILQNLNQRFAKAGIKNYHSFVADLTQPINPSTHQPVNLIICDAPCSGSGTWGRTPEQLYFFSKERISDYVALQRKIISNTIPHLANSGYFLYITCSVFKNENEAAVAFIKKAFHLELIKMECLQGYSQKADSMFAALFKKG